MAESNKHIVPRDIEAESLVDYCIHAFPMLGSRSAVKKAIFKEQLFLNEAPAKLRDIIHSGDKLRLQRVQSRRVKKVKSDLETIYEDDFLLVINKPGGMAVNGLRNNTVENAVCDRIQYNTNADALERPIAVHRIDVPTSGLVMLAKTKGMLIKLSRAFQHKRVQKEYVALVHGKTASSGTIVGPIQEKRSVTEFQRVGLAPSRIFGYISLLKVKPLTGRTHQIRIHLRSKGHLIVGDKMYAEGKKTILGKGLFLCARALTFKHPGTGEKLHLEIDIPAKYQKVLDRERDRF